MNRIDCQAFRGCRFDEQRLGNMHPGVDQVPPVVSDNRSRGGPLSCTSTAAVHAVCRPAGHLVRSFTAR